VSVRPQWLPPDRIPRDLDLSRKSLLAECNANDPVIHPSVLLLHNKFGFRKKPVALKSSQPNFGSVLPYNSQRMTAAQTGFLLDDVGALYLHLSMSTLICLILYILQLYTANYNYYQTLLLVHTKKLDKSNTSWVCSESVKETC